jgi:tRNA (guanosine-2'-O-)-methyltransferase
VPDSEHYRGALAVGDTLRLSRRPCIHWLRQGKEGWVAAQRAAGWRIVAVELAEGATALPRLQPARERTVVLLGHERHGVREELVDGADECVEIPMVGDGASLNVAVAGSLVLYRLAGLALAQLRAITSTTVATASTAPATVNEAMTANGSVAGSPRSRLR